MDLKDAKAFVNLVRAEDKRRRDLLPEDGDAAYDQWMFTDQPFLLDLCILYLIALRHHVERRLLFHASCALGGGQQIKHSEFKAQRDNLLAIKPNRARWEEINRRLQPSKCARYSTVKALQLLANSYKHSPNLQPDIELVRHLGLDEKLIYQPIPESHELKRGLARFVGIAEESPSPEIVVRFVEHVDEFLTDIQAKNLLSPVSGRRASLIEFAH